MRIEVVVELLLSLTLRDTSPGAPASPYDVPPFNFVYYVSFKNTETISVDNKLFNSCRYSQLRNKCCVKLVCVRRICSYQVYICDI